MTLVRRIRRRSTRRIHEVSTAWGLDQVLDRAVFLRTNTTGLEARVPAHVVIAPPGGGNIGDQAMVEAFLENTTEPVRIIVRSTEDIRVPVQHADRVELEEIPALLYGDGKPHRQAVAHYRRLLASALSVSVVGADIMDGAYNVRASARRSDAATLATTVGVDARILGFSWNGHANRGSRLALARAGKHGVRLLLRDPVSAARARADGLQNVTEVADSVFAARTSSSNVLTELLGTPAPPYAVVNASGLVGRSMDQVTEYATIVRWLLDQGLTVVLLPHVVRDSADDATACRAVHARVDDPRVILVDRILEPAEVRGLCAEAKLVLTGRMHLAIQSMWNTVPAITLSTQGKVEGLMRLFDTDSLCVSPGAGLADRVLPLAADLLANRDRYRAGIAARLPSVRALADLNFSSLPHALASRSTDDFPENRG